EAVKLCAEAGDLGDPVGVGGCRVLGVRVGNRRIPAVVVVTGGRIHTVVVVAVGSFPVQLHLKPGDLGDAVPVRHRGIVGIVVVPEGGVRRIVVVTGGCLSVKGRLQPRDVGDVVAVVDVGLAGQI